MKSRLLASLAIGAAVVIGTTGCSMLAPQGTTVQYSPSDGLNVPNTAGPLLVRNALIVANKDGSKGNLVAAIVNDTDSSAVLNIEVGEGTAAVTKTVRVPAGVTKSLGGESVEGVENLEGVDPLLITGLEMRPGSTVSVYFQSGDGQGARVALPVLDGTLAHLTPLAP